MLNTRSTSLLGVAALMLLLLATSRIAAPPRTPGFKPYTAAETFEMHFGTPLPKKVRVLHYYGEDLGMDPSFAWELTPVDDALLKKVAKNAGLRKATPTARPNPADYNW